jgi:hypothetical protein
MSRSRTPEQSTPDPGWSLTSDPLPIRETEEPDSTPSSPPEIRGQCLLFCNRCGMPSDGRSEFCQRCGAKRCVNCGE